MTIHVFGERHWVYDNTTKHTFNDVCFVMVDSEFFTIPVGFTTDFCSAGVFKFLFNSFDFRVASVVHDVCYKYQLHSFEYSNKLFIDILHRLGAPVWKIKVCELALSTPIARRRYDSYKLEII